MLGTSSLCQKQETLTNTARCTHTPPRCVEMWLESGDDIGDSVGSVASVGVGIGIGVGGGDGDGDGVVV